MSNSNPLLFAAKYGQLAVVKNLLKKNSTNINHQDEEYGDTALMIAARNGHESILEHLIEKGADVNLQDKKCCSALMAAAYGGHKTIVKHLIEKGADVILMVQPLS